MRDEVLVQGENFGRGGWWGQRHYVIGPTMIHIMKYHHWVFEGESSF